MKICCYEYLMLMDISFKLTIKSFTLIFQLGQFMYSQFAIFYRTRVLGCACHANHVSGKRSIFLVCTGIQSQ